LLLSFVAVQYCNIILCLCAIFATLKFRIFDYFLKMSRPCGFKCAYVNCGKSARSESGLKLFRFPKDVNTSRSGYRTVVRIFLLLIILK